MTKNNGKKKGKSNYGNKYQRSKNESTKRTQERKSSSSSNDLFSGFGKIDDVSDACHLHLDSKINENGNEGNKKMGITKPKGLMNLGNTCYANSVLQVLSQTQLLSERLTERLTKRTEWRVLSEQLTNRLWKQALKGVSVDCNSKKEECENERILETVLPAATSLSVYLAEFLRDMNTNNLCNVVSPSRVINGMSTKYSQFRGRDQQDSHEFLRCILDAIRNDETRRQRLAIMNTFNIEYRKDNNYDEPAKTAVKPFGHASNFTLIDEIFGGFLLCSVKCEECDSVSQHFEPFFDLSLPVSEEKHKHKIQRKGKDKDDTNEENVNVPNLANESVVNLSTKDRKLRRQQKKAVKREQKLNKRKMGGNSKVENNETDENEVNTTEVDNDLTEKVNDTNEVTEQQIVTGCNGLKDGFHTDFVEMNVENTRVNGERENQCKDDKTETQGEFVNEMNGEEDADDEAISEEEKSVNVITSEFESMDINKGESLCDNLNEIKKENERIRTVSVSLEEKEYREKVKWCLGTISARSVEPGATSILSCLASFTSSELLVGANKLICESCGEKFKAKTGIQKKVYSNASKHMTIAFPPPVLTLHLKRFEAEGYHTVNLRKITRMVHFPLTFDLSPFVSNLYEPLSWIFGNGEHFSRTITYRLFGVVEHSGSLRSGHYTAFVKVRTKSDYLKKFARTVPFSTKVEEILEQLNLDSLSSTESRSATFDNDDGRWFHISDTVVNASSVDRVLHSQAYILFYERVETNNTGPTILDSQQC
ncbi:hypothetical protein B4U80_00521 [Leptotrombidium deliense]|uniref:Ubiquitin carboxyl-terminal hydrolase n=1 Tax=Leptotrombidium deliense TaxID=299467 RepID=A0A443SCD7_9ACAR|nr:hypothetical protein B4U80_00521 [Leptotrombidium deliense]